MSTRTPVTAIRDFIEAEFPNALEQIYFQVLTTVASEKVMDLFGSDDYLQALKQLFDEVFADDACSQYEAVHRANLLRVMLDFHFWGVIDPEELAGFDRFVAKGESKGLEGTDRLRAGRERHVSEVRAALPKWEALKAGEASFSAIEAHSTDLWLDSEKARG